MQLSGAKSGTANAPDPAPFWRIVRGILGYRRGPTRKREPKCAINLPMPKSTAFLSKVTLLFAEMWNVVRSHKGQEPWHVNRYLGPC
jgi:hypothetical protein